MAQILLVNDCLVTTPTCEQELLIAFDAPNSSPLYANGDYNIFLEVQRDGVSLQIPLMISLTDDNVGFTVDVTNPIWSDFVMRTDPEEAYEIPDLTREYEVGSDIEFQLSTW